MTKKIEEIIKDIYELLKEMDKLEIKIIDNTIENEKKINNYKNNLDDIINEYHNLCKKIYK